MESFYDLELGFEEILLPLEFDEISIEEVLDIEDNLMVQSEPTKPYIGEKLSNRDLVF